MFRVSLDKMADKAFSTFSMKFSNGYTVWLALGDGTYSTGDFSNGFTTVEVDAWGPDGEWVQLEENGSDVVGWQSADSVLALLNRIASL